MRWAVIYHHGVEEDLESIGPSSAKRVVRAIDEKLTRQPMKFGSPLSGGLADFRKLRVGDYRVVYQVQEKTVLVYVLAVGPRRDKEIYRLALKRKWGPVKPAIAPKSSMLSPQAKKLIRMFEDAPDSGGYFGHEVTREFIHDSSNENAFQPQHFSCIMHYMIASDQFGVKAPAAGNVDGI